MRIFENNKILLNTHERNLKKRLEHVTKIKNYPKRFKK